MSGTLATSDLRSRRGAFPSAGAAPGGGSYPGGGAGSWPSAGGPADGAAAAPLGGGGGAAWGQQQQHQHYQQHGGGWHGGGGGGGPASPGQYHPAPQAGGGGGGASAGATSRGGIGGMSTELRWTFALILLTAVCLHADQNLAAPNLSAIAQDFQMTPLQKDTRLGGIVQFGFFLIGGAVSLLMGPTTDQVDRITLLSLVVLSGCLPSLCMSLWVPSSKAGFFYYLLARICTGIAIGGSFPVLFSLTADIFPASQRAFVAACISAATNIGAAVGGMMSGIVGPRYGWRLPFQIVAVPALACAVLVRLFLVDPRTAKRRKEKDESEVHNPAFSAWAGSEGTAPSGYIRMEELDFTKFGRILELKTNVLVFAQALPGCIPLSVIVTFLADYLAVEQGMKVEASTAVTAVFGLSCLCFAVSGGIYGQRLYNRRKDLLPLLIGATTSFAPLPFIVLVNSPRGAVTSAAGRPTALALFLALLGGSAAVAGPNIRAILMNVNDGEVRGTVFSAFTLFDDLGKGLGPSIIVAATALLGRRTAYTLAFTLWWLSGAILLSLRASLPRDAARGGSSLLPFKSK